MSGAGDTTPPTPAAGGQGAAGSSPPAGSAPTGKDRWLPLFVVTVVLLLVFIGVTAWLMFDADDVSNSVWTRRVYLAGGLEAIVFTAIGWLFGREVHRGEAESAKADAAKSKDDAAKATEEATTQARRADIAVTKGQATRSAVRNVAAAGTRGDEGARPVGLDQGATPAADPYASLVGLVDDLWRDEET